MRTRSLLGFTTFTTFALCASWALLVACSDGDDSAAPPVTDDAAVADAAADGGLAPDAEDAFPHPCNDCEYFPATCTPDVLCTNDVVDGRVRISVIRGRSDSDVWAGGAKGTVLHFDGASWTRSDLGSTETVHAFWLRDASEVSIVSLRSLYTRGLTMPDAGAPSTGGWSAQPRPPTPDDFLDSTQVEGAWSPPGSEWLWCATASADAYPPGISGLWRMHVAPSTQSFEVVDAIPPNTCLDLRCTLTTSVHGASADDVWAVGLGGSTFHVTDAQSDTPSITAYDSQTTATLYGVWVASVNEAWSVGGAGAIRRYTGAAPRWDVVPDVPTIATLRAVWGWSATDIWAVGDGAVVLHFDGATWTRVKIAGLGDRRPDLYTVWSPGPGRAWIGGDGVLLSVGGTR